MPIVSSLSYDNLGKPYNSNRVIIDGQFDLNACEPLQAISYSH